MKPKHPTKFEGIIICCENLRFLDSILSIKHLFENRFKIKCKINYRCLRDGCLVDEANKNHYRNHLLMCLTTSMVMKRTEGDFFESIHHTNLSEKDRKIYESKDCCVKTFAVGGFAESEKMGTAFIIIDMDLLTRPEYENLAHPLDIILHELLHMRRDKCCNNGACIGFGWNNTHRKGAVALCKNCSEQLNIILKQRFVRKTK